MRNFWPEFNEKSSPFLKRIGASSINCVGRPWQTTVFIPKCHALIVRSSVINSDKIKRRCSVRRHVLSHNSLENIKDVANVTVYQEFNRWSQSESFRRFWMCNQSQDDDSVGGHCMQDVFRRLGWGTSYDDCWGNWLSDYNSIITETQSSSDFNFTNFSSCKPFCCDVNSTKTQFPCSFLGNLFARQTCRYRSSSSWH